MDSGTDTWVIVVAAFGGGLAGAVLQPLVNYLLQLRTRRHDVEAEINQGLRRMVYAWLDRGGKVAFLAIEVDSKARHGLPPVPPEERSDRLNFGTNFPTLQTWRIEDDILRGLVDEHQEVVRTLLTLCFIPVDDESVMRDLAKLMKELPRKVTLRMDKLGWPEAHWEGVEMGDTAHRPR